MPTQSSRQSLYPGYQIHQQQTLNQMANPSSTASSSAVASSGMSTAKARQYAHLHSQLAQLNAHLADTDNLVKMTAIQAQDMRFLGGYVGSMLMGSAKVLGEESVRGKSEVEGEAGADGSSMSKEA